MRYGLVLVFALLFLGGCTSNSKNLSFASKTSQDFRVTFHCTVPFDDIRLVRSFEQDNTTKDVYFVEFNDIYESYFEVTQTKDKNANFSIEEYAQFIENDGATVHLSEIHDRILYLSFTKRNKQLHQIVHANSQKLTIVNAEPMMFNTIKNYCKNK